MVHTFWWSGDLKVYDSLRVLDFMWEKFKDEPAQSLK